MKRQNNSALEFYKDCYNKVLETNSENDNIVGRCIEILLPSQMLDSKRYIAVWGDDIDKIGQMPRDVFTYLVQKPTHYAVAAIMNGFLRSAKIREFDDMLRILVCGMRGACLCGLAGHGYESEDVLKENLAIYEAAGVDEFLERFGYLCPEFTAMVVNYKNATARKIRSREDAEWK